MMMNNFFVHCPYRLMCHFISHDISINIYIHLLSGPRP